MFRSSTILFWAIFLCFIVVPSQDTPPLSIYSHYIHFDQAEKGFTSEETHLFKGEELYTFDVRKGVAQRYLDIALPIRIFAVGESSSRLRIVALVRCGRAEELYTLYDEWSFARYDVLEKDIRHIIVLPKAYRAKLLNITISYTFRGYADIEPLWEFGVRGVTVLGQ